MKYPRTLHLPYSPNRTKDDCVLKSTEHFLNQYIIINEKLDGGNICMSRNQIHARSESELSKHESFNWLKRFYDEKKFILDIDKYLYCEYLFAQHSIHYSSLPNYLMAFAVYDDSEKEWWDWDKIIDYADKIQIPTVPVLWEGVVSTEKALEKIVINLANQPSLYGGFREGVVVRLAESFTDFSISVAKYVNEFERTTHGWKYKKIIRNKLLHEL